VRGTLAPSTRCPQTAGSRAPRASGCIGRFRARCLLSSVWPVFSPRRRGTRLPRAPTTGDQPEGVPVCGGTVIARIRDFSVANGAGRRRFFGRDGVPPERLARHIRRMPVLPIVPRLSPGRKERGNGGVQPAVIARAGSARTARRGTTATRPRRARVPMTSSRKATVHGHEPAVGVRTTPPMGFGAFRRSQLRRSLRAGLPRRHLPLSEFLTLSAVSSLRNLVAVFQATSARRLSAFRAFSARPAASSLEVACSLVVEPAWHRVCGAMHDFDLRALLRPNVRHPSSHDLRCRRAAALLAFLLSEACRCRLSAKRLPSRASLTKSLRLHVAPSCVAPQGVADGPGTDFEKSIQPP
jgi:hypothetical protein